MIKRDQIVVPDFYKPYLKAVKEDNLVKALKKSHKKFMKLLKQIPKEKRDYAYAEGKWTIRQLLQHIIDAERVFCFRALWFARKDPAALPGFDENNWTDSLNGTKRKWKEMIREFNALRIANIHLFESFGDDQLLRTGSSNNSVVSVAAFGYIAAGHVEHHIRVINQRYLSITIDQAI